MSERSRAPRVAVDIAVAFQFLTRLPMPNVPFAPDGLARSVKFFPLVGLVIGLGAALLQKIVTPHLGRPGSAIVVLVYLVLITGCFHEDGLADVADSMGGWNPEQRLLIPRPAVGRLTTRPLHRLCRLRTCTVPLVDPAAQLLLAACAHGRRPGGTGGPPHHPRVADRRVAVYLRYRDCVVA
jgi:hypothetical protein